MKTTLKLTVAAIALMMLWAATATAQEWRDICYDTEEREVVVGVNPITGEPVTRTILVDEYNEECNVIRDGRENRNDRAAEGAVYCTDIGVDIYDINFGGEGELIIRSTWSEIDAVPNPPEVNTLIEGAPGFGLYRLTTGELQLNGPADWEGKPYVFIWDGCERPENSE